MLYIIYHIFIIHILYYISYIIHFPFINTSIIEAQRLRNRGLEAPKSSSRGSKIEVLGRHGGLLGRLGRLGASREAPERPQEAPRRRLGAVLGPSWGGRRPSLGRLGAILELSEAIIGRLSACNGDKMRHSILYVVFD